MLYELFETIKTLQDRIKHHKDYFHQGGKPEARARTALIDPMLSVLGWDVTDPDRVEIEPNTKTKSDSYGADYALIDENRVRVLFLEAKKLADKTPAMSQAIAYTVEENRNSRTNVLYCGWTNGDMWEVYHIRSEKSVVLELVLSRDSAAECALKFFSLWYPSMRDGIFVPVRSVALPGSEVVPGEHPRSELPGGDRVKQGDPELYRRKDNKPTPITPPVPDDGAIQGIYQVLRGHLRALGDDVQEKTRKHYVAFKRRHNFALVWKRQQKIAIELLNVGPGTIDVEEGFSRRRPRSVGGHRPCVEVTIRSREDLRRAEPLLKKCYDAAS